MSTFKRAKVIMLATNKPSKLGNLATYQGRSLAKVIKEGVKPINTIVQFWNLYIISDDEIKENNTHFYNPHSGQLHISGNHTDYIAINKNGCKKIIATTDTSLDLPQPSQQFIQKYIEGYNKDNVITDVLVEYQTDFKSETKLYMLGMGDNPDDFEYGEPTVKINPKDNTTTIKKVKDSYTREEHISNIKKFSLELGSKIHCFLKEDGTLSISIQDVNKWIEENL